MTNMSRRAFTLALPSLSILGATGLSTRPALSESLGGSALVPMAQMTIGRFKVTALSDGYADMPFEYFTGWTPEDIESAASKVFAARPGGIRLVFNQYLIEDGDIRILIDAGPAGALGVSGGLPAGLAAAGVPAEEIDAVIVTHLHADHSGGLIAGGRRNFANAEVFIDRRDVAYWTDAGKRSAAPEFLNSSFDAAAEVVRLYPTIQAIEGEHEIVPGITTVDLTGHTPGHIGVRIEDDGQSLIMVSDMLFHPAIHPVAADIGFVFEQDPAAAREMRASFFPRAADEGALIAATHMPFPGLGRIVSDNGQMRWLTAEWAHQV
jgi:glyoxylase-like metal-dependent hydrolase (beta-lactamase superfamily II)